MMDAFRVFDQDDSGNLPFLVSLSLAIPSLAYPSQSRSPSLLLSFALVRSLVLMIPYSCSHDPLLLFSLSLAPARTPPAPAPVLAHALSCSELDVGVGVLGCCADAVLLGCCADGVLC